MRKTTVLFFVNRKTDVWVFVTKAPPFDPSFFYYRNNLCEFENICALPKDLDVRENSVLTLH